jgi:glutathione S-transferase
MKLYILSGSPPARRVQMYLEERNMKYELIVLSGSDKQQKTEEFLKLNPRGKVPVLVDDETVLYESLAIIHYLENKYPGI